MPFANANGISLFYESFGSRDGEAVLLINGHRGQLTGWPVELCDALAMRGFNAIRYDNRDIGLSTKFSALGIPAWDAIHQAKATGAPLPIPYALDDMARDAVGLLDALEIERAHIVGCSMGGMIAQLIAADFPERTLSLTTIMCTASNPDIPIITAEALRVLGAQPSSREPSAVIEHFVVQAQWRQGPGYPTSREQLVAAVTEEVERDYDPAAWARQGAASATAYDRRTKLKTIKAPTVVVHGENDPCVPIEGAYDIVRCVPGAELRIIPGMGHDLPAALAPALTEAIARAAERAHAGRSSEV